jgi:hypothetical protein
MLTRPIPRDASFSCHGLLVSSFLFVSWSPHLLSALPLSSVSYPSPRSYSRSQTPSSHPCRPCAPRGQLARSPQPRRRRPASSGPCWSMTPRPPHLPPLHHRFPIAAATRPPFSRPSAGRTCRAPSSTASTATWPALARVGMRRQGGGAQVRRVWAGWRSWRRVLGATMQQRLRRCVRRVALCRACATCCLVPCVCDVLPCAVRVRLVAGVSVAFCHA